MRRILTMFLVSVAALTWVVSETPPTKTEVASDAIADVLDDFHAAAAAADEERYFAHFAPDGVFLGTDATERWTVAEFREYAHPHFSEGRGWTYVPHDRYIALSESGTVAWIDEELTNEKYGELRGTGVLRKIDNEWKLAHYSLTFTIPNEKSADVVAALQDGNPQD
jgi:ketosteroid isomerase-like protein